MRGKFITLEGGEGVGKSTQLAVVEATLREAGLDVLVTREPGGTPRAERIRELLLAREQEAMPEVCELLLMFAARATHLHNVIVPALRQGTWVVCDRFTDATYAYQGYGRGLSLEHIGILESWVQAGLQPDLTLLLDAPVSQTMMRVQERHRAQGVQADRFEVERQAFFERVRAGYLKRAAESGGRFQVIDASASLPEVSAAVQQCLSAFIAQGRQQPKVKST